MNIQSIGSSPTQQNTSGAPVVSRGGTIVTPVGVQKKEAATPSQPATQEQVESAIKSVREYIEPFNSKLEFSINDDTDQVVIKVIDKDTKEVIRQIPSEEMLAIAKALDSIKGLFIKQNA